MARVRNPASPTFLTGNKSGPALTPSTPPGQTGPRGTVGRALPPATPPVSSTIPSPQTPPPAPNVGAPQRDLPPARVPGATAGTQVPAAMTPATTAPVPVMPGSPTPAPANNKLAFIKKGNEVDMTTMGVRPLRLQDMLKTAMAQSASKVNVSLEAARQMEASGDVTEKQASASGSVDHEYALKLASAIEYIAKESSEGKNIQGIGRGPNTLGVSEARGGEHTSDNQGQGHHTVPMSTPLQASGHGPATQMENDHARAPGGPGHQTTAMTAGQGKVASIRGAFKTASIATSARKMQKQAEDAINPAHISAGSAVEPDTSACGESGGNPVGGAPQGPSGLVGSNESAMNYQKGTAYAPRKAELGKYYKEPALSGATDKTLANAFENTAKAGTKFASVGTGTKVAAARAVLEKLAEETNKKKESAANGG